MPITDTVPATDRQLTFLRDLVKDRTWSLDTVDGDVHETCMNSMVPDMYIAKSEASAAIDALLKCPKVQRARTAGVDLNSLPVSKYAFPSNQGPQFFEIVERRGGRRYMNQLIGAPGDWRRLRMSMARIATVAARIAEDPKAAALAYSRLHGRCAACESPLSDPESIARGFGPVCFGRY